MASWFPSMVLLSCLAMAPAHAKAFAETSHDRAEPLATRPVFDARSRVPVILVPGWGYDWSLRAFGRDVFSSYRNWLTTAGVRPEDIHVLHYSYMDDLPQIERELSHQLREIVGRYPSRTQFDMMGHSLGGFVGLYAMMESGLSPRFRLFVSLSGIPFGWNSDSCDRGWCGKAHLRLTPFRSPFVTAFHQKHKAAMARMAKCSLYSRADEFVKPYDAGRFADGINVEVANMRHMDTVFSQRAFDGMLRGCYVRR